MADTKPSQTLLEKVTSGIKSGQDAVINQVVGHFVKKEQDRRADAVISAMDKLASYDRDLKKIKPDQVGFDLGGQKVSETYSKAKVDEMNKIKSATEKLEKALTKALENAEYGDLFNIIKGGGSESSTSSEPNS
jgi:hypothetical protein